MWGLPHFDLKPEEIETVMREVRACREAFPEAYIKVIAYDADLRPADERAELHRQPPVGRARLRARAHTRTATASSATAWCTSGRRPAPSRSATSRCAAPIRPRTGRERHTLRHGAHTAGGSRGGARRSATPTRRRPTVRFADAGRPRRGPRRDERRRGARPARPRADRARSRSRPASARSRRCC